MGVEKPLLEANRNSIEVLDLLDHSVGRAPQLAVTPLLGQCAVTTLHQLAVREFLGFAHRILDAHARNTAVILVRDFGRRLCKHQAAEVLDAVVARSQSYEVFLRINRDRSDLMVGAGGGWGHHMRTAGTTLL